MSTATQTTEDYLVRYSEPDARLREVAATLPLHESLRESISGRVFGRPLFVDRAEIDQVTTDAIRVFDLIVSLPNRLFGGDLFAFCAAIRVDPRLVPSLLRGYGSEPVVRYGRADLYHDGKAFRLLEFNIDSEIGGLSSASELPRLFAENEYFREFAGGRDLSFTQPTERLAEALRQLAAPLSGGRDPVVALLQMDAPVPGQEDYHNRRSLEQIMRGFGLDFRFDTIGGVTESGGRLHHRGDPVDVVLRGFSAYHIMTKPGGRQLTEPLFRVAEQDGVAIWTPLYSQLFINKTCLAYLSDPRYSRHFSSEELAVIDRVVPWTRALRPDVEPTEEPWLLDKDELILKPSFQYGGAGIVAGWECDNQTWISALRKCAPEGAIVQRRVVPREEPMFNPTSGKRENWKAVWGLFVTPAGYAGLRARLVTESASSVISFATDGQTRVAPVFTV